MIVRLHANASPAERDALLAALVRLGARATETSGGVEIEDALAAADAHEIAAMAGVAAIEAGETVRATRREAILDWIAGASAILGVLVVAAANLPAPLGLPADPLRTPPDLLPVWPLLAGYGAVDAAPAWLPAPLLLVVAALVLLFWPSVGRRLAERRPGVHAALGAAAVAGAVVLALREVVR